MDSDENKKLIGVADSVFSVVANITRKWCN